MTYCVACRVKEGLVFASDSRTNAGVDQLGTVSKMHCFEFGDDPARFLVLLSAGNLATTQSVVARLTREINMREEENLATVEDLDIAAEHVGRISVEEQRKHQQVRSEGDFRPEASFILGGQVGDARPGIAHIYPEGNFIRGSSSMPFLQIGEVKYGKPILDRIVLNDSALDQVVKCVLVSMDSTMRSNATVGLPIKFLVYRNNTFRPSITATLSEDDAYLQSLRNKWADSIVRAFESLPSPPGFDEEAMEMNAIASFGRTA